MEGDGEGMMAILQGTINAGLRVTLLPDNRPRSKRKCVLMNFGATPPTRTTQSSVETNTERIFQNASVTMYDVRYASNCQFANCKAVQSCFRVSEFPQHSTFYRHTDHFANSLRKYPVQASSEILQRIINYSNVKQNTRKQNLRSRRSLLRKSKSQQMNRRHENGVNTNNEIYERKPLNKSIPSIGRKYLSQKELLNYTYDYLKCRSLIPRSTDVRYFSQIKNHIRNRLLDIIDDRPVICSRIRSRYSRHKRHFHEPIARPVLASNRNEIQDSSRTKQFTDMVCKNTSYSYIRRQSCFCHQPKKCNCTPKLYMQNPLDSLMRNLYPELRVNKKKISSKQIVLEPKIHEPEDVTINPYVGVDDKIMTAVLDWLKLIPVHTSFSVNDKIKQEELALRLAENLSSLKNHVDFISKAEKEIISCVNDLPMWYPPALNEKKQFINQIVADLLKRLADILDNELRYKVAQAISNLSYTENVDTKKFVDDFVQKIKPIVLHPPEDERDYIQVLKPRILDLLNKLQIQLSNEKIDDFADKLVNQLLQLRTVGEDVITVDENTFKENILKWLENVPELEGIDFAKNMILIDELAKQFKDYASRGPKDESLQGELVKAIRAWLEDFVDSLNLGFNSKTKNRLSNKMANHFFGRDYNNLLNKRKEKNEFSTSQEALEPLLKWYYGIKELVGGERADTRKAIDGLAKELNDIQSRDYSSETMLKGMKEVVTDWLQNMLKIRNKHLNSKDLDNFVNGLISELNVFPKRKKQRSGGEYGQFYKDIVSWIKNIPYLKPESHLNLTKEIEKLVNKLNNIRKESDLESTLNKAVTKFVQTLSESLQVRINEEDIQILEDILFERLKHRDKQRKRWEKKNDFCWSILSEFSNTLQAYSDILGDTKVINNKFYRKFSENVEDNVLPNWDYLRRQLNNIFIQETILPKHECEDLANNIITRLQKIFPLEITRRSTILSQPVKTYVEPRMNENILDATKKHRVQKYSNDPESTCAKKNPKRKLQCKINLQEAGDGRKCRKRYKMSTIYKSSTSDLDTHDSLDYYDNDYETNEKQNDHSEFYKHEERTTSTPLSAPIKNFPTALDVGSSTENLTTDSKITYDSKLSKQSQYLMELKDVIMDWIESIGLSTNNLDVDSVVDSITSDIIDRQKYLQLSKAKYSENDELEHLKYQIFRKLNKFKKSDILPHIMSKINSLNCLLKNISVPDLIKPINESHIPTSLSHNNIFNKISHWLDRVPSNLLKSKDIKQNPDLLNKLVQDIKNIKKNSQYDYQIEKYILQWLQNALKKCNDNIFHELAEALKSSLQDAVVKTSSILKEDTSDLIDENIAEAIVTWLQNAPFYNCCTLDERDLQEKLALLLTTNLRNILQTPKNEADNENDQLMEEVQKYLKTIPIPIEFRNNKYYYKAASELVKYLKPMINEIKEMIDDSNDISSTYEETNTQNDFVDYNDLIKNIMNNWCDNLPIHLGHSFESKEQAKKLKQNIAMGLLEKLSDINRKEPDNDIAFEIKLSDEIHKIFQNVPMNRELEKSIPILKSILIDKLKQAKNQTQNLNPKKVLQDTLTKTLQEIGNTSELEQSSLDLLKEKLADAFIKLHFHASTDYEFCDKLKDKLYNEIDKFCNAYLERVPFSPIDSDELRHNLYALLKKISKPDMQQHPDISDVASTSSFQKEVRLKNGTTKYSSPQFLSSTLSNEDRAYLETIRQRTASYTETTKSKQPHKNWSPHLTDKGVVTDYKRKVEENVKLKDIGVVTDSKKNVEKNVQTSGPLLPETISHSKDVLPQVVIKEFYWDSTGSKHNFKMFVLPGLTSHKTIQRKTDTNNSYKDTGTNVIDNSTKVNDSQQLTDTRKGSNNLFLSALADKALGANPYNNENQEHYTNTYVNSPVQKSQNNPTLMLSKETTHGQSRTEKPFHQNRRKCDTYPDIDFDYGIRERYWTEQPRHFDDDRYILKDHRQPNSLEDFLNIPNDRRMLTKRMFWNSDNRNKECMMCDFKTNCKMDGRSCKTLKYCSKCCGKFCPHPTMAFFKKTF